MDRLIGYGSSLWNHLIFARDVFWSISVFPEVLWCFNFVYMYDSWIRMRSDPNLKLLWRTFDPKATCAISSLKTNIAPENRPSQKGKDRLWNINFQGENVSFTECRYRLSGITGTVGTMETLSWLWKPAWLGQVGLSCLAFSLRSWICLKCLQQIHKYNPSF